MKVDLNFPLTPHVSSEAKDLIGRVSRLVKCLLFDHYFWFGSEFIEFFLAQLLVKDSSRRLSLQKIVEHPWIIENADPSGICNTS